MSLREEVAEMLDENEDELAHGGWISTITGRRVFLASPKPGDVCVKDIAWGLARENRFANHITAPHYSVAQHSVLVSEIVEEMVANALRGELDGCVEAMEPEVAEILPVHAQFHDSPEAYLGDVVKPLKELLPEYKVIEDKWALAIGRALGWGDALVKLHPFIKRADMIALATERRDVQSPEQQRCLERHGIRARERVEPLARRIVPLSPPEAHAMFWARLREIAPEMARRAEAVL